MQTTSSLSLLCFPLQSMSESGRSIDQSLVSRPPPCLIPPRTVTLTYVHVSGADVAWNKGHNDKNLHLLKVDSASQNVVITNSAIWSA